MSTPVTAERGKAPGFVERSTQPLTGGPQPERLLHQRTAMEDFFVRNHAFVDPTLDLDTWHLAITSRDGTRASLRYEQLETLERCEVEATLQCAGNRRSGLIRVRDVPGEVPWGDEAVSSALWSGWRVRDVLALAGVEGPDGAHVEFVGADRIAKPEGEVRFGGSIPASKAFSDEVILADRINGEQLPLVHGFPVRLIVPGYVGARSVKWIDSITMLDEPSDNFYQRGYSLYPSHMTRDDYDPEAGVMLGELPVNSAICVPVEGANVAAGTVHIAGWATPGGERHIARVEVSVDGGDTWTEASFREPARSFVWTQWELHVDLPAGDHVVLARAADSDGVEQPRDAAPLWNFKGYMNNAWHRITVHAG